MNSTLKLTSYTSITPYAWFGSIPAGASL